MLLVLRSTSRVAKAATDALPEGHFKFVQFDFAGSLGIPAGRWVVRDSEESETSHVLIIEELAGDKPSRKQRSIKAPPAASTLTLTRVTVVDVLNLGLDQAGRISDAVTVVDKALHARALAGREDHLQLSTPPWIGLRVGVGSGEQVAHSEWLEAEEVPLPETQKASRRRAEPVKGRFAELLGGKGTEDEQEQLAEAPGLVELLREVLSRRA